MKKPAEKRKELPESYRKVLYYFFSFPERSISLNNLSKAIGASKTAATMAVASLITEKFLLKEVVGKTWRIYANQKHQYIVTKKIPYNLGLIYETGIIAKIYSKHPEAHAIILFGSYRWGTDNEASDIDIAVEILSKEMHIETIETLEQLGFRKKVRVNLHVFSRNKINLNLFTNIANGIVLDGLLEVRP